MAMPRHFSEASAQGVDKAVQELLRTAETTATDLLRAHRSDLDRVIEALEKEEDLGRERVEELLGAHRATAAGGIKRPAASR
jgi:cell division protease FtsH